MQKYDEFGRPVGGEKEGRGCFFYGCVTLIALLCLLVIGGYFAVRKGIDWAVNEFSSETKLEITQFTPDPGEFTRVSAKVEEFVEDVNSGNSLKPMILTERDINAFLSGQEVLKDTVYVDINKDVMKIEVSFPLTEWGYKGRFVNALAEFKGKLENGELFIEPISLKIADKDVPAESLNAIREKDFLQELKQKNQNQEAAEFLEKLETVEIKDGNVIIVPKSKS